VILSLRGQAGNLRLGFDSDSLIAPDDFRGTPEFVVLVVAIDDQALPRLRQTFRNVE